MNKKILGFGLAGLVVLVAIAAFFLRPAPEASAPLEAVPLATQAPTSASAVVEAPAASSEGSASDSPQAAPATPEQQAAAPVEATATRPAPTATSAPAQAPAPQSAMEISPNAVIFSISQADSYAQFSIDEILNNSPFTAVGVTNQVAGEIGVDFGNPPASAVGVIQVNARTLQTDNEFRDGQIANNILQTRRYEFITFIPKALKGMPAQVSVGDRITFEIVGDLQIKDVTKETTFQMEVLVASMERLEGVGRAMVLRSDYGITIPEVPRVAGVSDQVFLEIGFVAVKK